MQAGISSHEGLLSKVHESQTHTLPADSFLWSLESCVRCLLRIMNHQSQDEICPIAGHSMPLT